MAARFLRFNVVGALGMLVQLGLLALLAGSLGWRYRAATIVAVETAIVHNFLWHCRWTWRDRPAAGLTRLAARLLRFNSTNGAVSLAGNLLVMELLTGGCGWPPLAANGVAIALAATLNFMLSDRLVFAPPSITDPPAARS